MFGYHYYHEIVVTKKGTIILIDVADTFDAGIESAYAIFDEEIFRNNWEGSEYTIEDIKGWGEEVGAFENWEIISSHHRSPESAYKNIMKVIKTM